MAKKTATRKSTSKPRTKAVNTTVSPRRTTKATTAYSKNTIKITASIFRKLKTLNLLYGFLLILLAGAVVLVGKPMQVDVVVYHLTKDILLSRGGETVLVVGSQPLFNIDVRWVLVTGLLITTIFYFTWTGEKYKNSLLEQKRLSRWVQYALSTSSIVLVVGLLVGILDIVTLLTLAGVTTLACGIDYCLEVLFAKNKSVAGILLISSIIAGGIVWLILKIYILGVIGLGLISLSWTVYGMYILLTIASLGLLTYQLSYYRQKGPWKSYYFSDFIYSLISFVTLAGISTLFILA